MQNLPNQKTEALFAHKPRKISKPKKVMYVKVLVNYKKSTDINSGINSDVNLGIYNKMYHYKQHFEITL